MGNPRGFLDIDFKGPEYRDIEERLKDYNEVELRLSENEIREQAGRCMDCGIPFCHGCGCPLENLIPEWNDLVYYGYWENALRILLSTNDFPEFTGRVCPAPCETACTVSLNGEAVSIRQIEIALVEKGFKEGYLKPSPPKFRTGKRVAVIGSGPAGLAVADKLNKFGHEVTVYERDLFAGGLLRYGIPDFKLSKSVVQRRINFMIKEGIIFETNVDVGRDLSAEYLQKRFDAICLACGAKAPRDLKVPGRDLDGIYFAMDFLSQQNRIINNEPIIRDRISGKDKRVVVIGGGDTGSDCVGTSNRHGALSVTQLEIMPMPPINRSEATPWPSWSYKLRNSSSQKEGCNRIWNIMTKSFEGENGKIKKINAVKVEWEFSENGLPISMKEVPNSDFVIEADAVFIAMGFTGVEQNRQLAQFKSNYDDRGNLKVDESWMTGIDKVFACGDAVSGASLVVRALKSGKDTALNINTFLS